MIPISSNNTLTINSEWYHKTGNIGVVKTLVKPDSKNFDERNVDKMLVKALISVLYCTLILLCGLTLKG